MTGTRKTEDKVRLILMYNILDNKILITFIGGFPYPRYANYTQGFSLDFFVGVCHPVLQIQTLS